LQQKYYFFQEMLLKYEKSLLFVCEISKKYVPLHSLPLKKWVFEAQKKEFFDRVT
jgi:hypothetical protein